MKFCCLIPAYKEAGRIGDVVRATRAYCDHVIVVDDGSGDGTAEEAEQAGAIVLRHPQNRGKGAALETGFAFVREQEYEAVITLDADGQHAPSDIPNFIKANRDTGAHVIVGSRMSHLEKMPLIRKWTNWFMSWLLSRHMKQWVPDTQCGYRFFVRDAIPAGSVQSKGFAAESEVLLYLADRGFRIGSAPVQTIYGEERSKINPVRDTIRFFSMLRRYQKQKGGSDGTAASFH